MAVKSNEVQNYIQQMVERRNREGIFDFDACQAILKHAAELNSEAVSGIGYYYFAEHYWFQGNHEKTMYCLAECTKCFQAAGMYEFLARAYNMMGAVTEIQQNRGAALNYYYTGLQYAESHGLTYVRAMLDTNIAHVLLGMRRYGEAARKYEEALRFYRASEDSMNRVYNLALCMTYCGYCCLKESQREKALELWDRVEELRRAYPDRPFPRLNLRVFEAECEAGRGNRNRFMECLDDIMECLREMEDVSEGGDCLVIIAELLLEQEEYGLLDEFFRIVDEKGLEKQPILSMNLYPCRSDLLLRRGRTEEYLRHTRKYFSAYEKDMQNNRQVTARALELRDKLKSMEKEREKIRASNRRLKNIALYDSMTNLANRTFLNEYVSARFEEAQREKRLLGVELMDIDCFKRYNDAYGHLAGDACIEAVAGVLRSVRGDRIFCGRYGDDEFMIVYHDMSLEQIRETAEEIQRRIRALAIPHSASDCADIVTVSQGIFVREPDEINREWDFNYQADRILYQAKGSGRNCYRIETEFAE